MLCPWVARHGRTYQCGTASVAVGLSRGAGSASGRHAATRKRRRRRSGTIMAASACGDVRMTWSRWYRFASYTKSSLWIVPFVAIVLEQIAFRLVLRIDDWLGWTFYEVGVHGVETALQT